MPVLRVAILILLLATSACGMRAPGPAQASLIQIDGSSTLYPIAEAVAEEFQKAHRGDVRVTVGISGTGGGFKKFCRGEIAISSASRPILSPEIAACAKAGVAYIELPVAMDAVTIAVNPANTWLDAISIDELKTLWQPQAQTRVLRWNQINPSWPDAPITLFGAGADSGTFDYFTEAVVGRAKASRGDFTASEDDNLLVTGVANDINALGFFGYAYFSENRTRLRAVAVRSSEGAAAVTPSLASVMDGSYQPLSRPMFIYVNADMVRQSDDLREFLRFYLREAAALATEVGYIPLPARAYTMALANLERGKVGTVFDGHSETGISVEQLLAREAR